MERLVRRPPLEGK